MKKLKSAKELGITEEQRKNIAKLTYFIYLNRKKLRFNIYWFHSSIFVPPSGVAYNCRTSACFCGHGPLANVEPLSFESWGDYAHRCFGSRRNRSAVWRMLFDENHVNDILAAAKRGAYFLMHGIPKTERLVRWEAPDDFVPNWRAIKRLSDK